MAAIDQLRAITEQGATFNGGGMEALFAAEVTRKNSVVQTIALASLHPFTLHTFQVQEGSADFLALKTAIEEHGIQTPLLVRPSATMPGSYEILSGHRRYRVAELLEMTTVPCTVHPCDDDTAIQLMAITNVQRPDWLPSEKAKTYKAHFEATQRKLGITQGMRTDLTSPTESAKLQNVGKGTRNDDITAKTWGISGDSLREYMKLNDLLPLLLQFTDQGRIVVKGAYQMAFLPSVQQQVVSTILEQHPKKKLSAAKAKEIRTIAQDAGELTEIDIHRVLGIVPKSDMPDGAEEVKEMMVKISFTSSAITNKKTAKQLLDDPDVLCEIEALLMATAEKYGLSLT